MNVIWKYLKEYFGRISLGMLIKFLGTLGELSLPYILEHIIDNIVPVGSLHLVLIWGMGMIFMAFLTRQLNVTANRMAVAVSKRAIFNLRHDFFAKTAHLSGSRFDNFGLPSLTSRMTSDTYNVQNFMTRMQTIGIRGPIMLIGGIALTMTMDVYLSSLLCIMVPLLLIVVLSISKKGVPLYGKVQKCVDNIVRIMRENITGIRVIKALSKESHEKERYAQANEDLTTNDIHASVIMAIPGPFMQLCLNTGLTLVVILGAYRVNSGAIQPGVILAFLTYFNLILQSVMGLNRIFVMYSKAKASADRIGLVLVDKPDQLVLTDEEVRRSIQPYEPAYDHDDPSLHIIFDHVSFMYHTDEELETTQEEKDDRDYSLSDVSFSVKKGESLGIIGSTGCGKTTIINLLMRFYDADKGQIFVDGKDVRTYEFDDLRSKFGVVFQNDIIFADTLMNNIDFGRGLTPEEVDTAADHGMAKPFIDNLEQGYDHTAAIKGADFSGGQKQRLMISRALAAHPKILILDDSSSALDYKTDAALRSAIKEHYAGTTTIMVAQRVSSIMNLNHILVVENGKILASGTHQELLENCNLYRTIYESQMGALA